MAASNILTYRMSDFFSIIIGFWNHFDRHLYTLLLLGGTKNVLKIFWKMGQISHWKMYEINESIEREILFETVCNWKDVNRMKERKSQGKWWVSDFHFFFLGGGHYWFHLMWISLLEMGILLCCVFILHIFLIYSLRVKYGTSST